VKKDLKDKDNKVHTCGGNFKLAAKHKALDTAVGVDNALDTAAVAESQRGRL
jgi:hypothetical protein